LTASDTDGRRFAPGISDKEIRVPVEPDERSRRISALHHAALERTPGERDAFLRAACQGDEALRQELESLLRYESESARFLETPAAAVVGGAARDSLEGTSMVRRTLGP
jgi:hypothetical protein